ncbi:hypothetical protein [Hoeflea poritis]|uniref:Lipoprotein n=1 Tax=Hoeflea poritis TaxID=2993659 RepID=A0ABT4VVL6_9HYPH|nr:hypothetical protein [Hoeflea poritis]MDA4848749.1 hypothetical protein [Hoeflea poritis]
MLPLVILAGCVSANLEDAAPPSAFTPDNTDPLAETGDNSKQAGEEATINQAEQPVRDNSFVTEGALRNEAFPTFAVMPKGATEQLSEEDKSAIRAEMESIKAARGRGGASTAYNARYNELKKIAETHGIETKDEIENE